jgi:hypothetical protein
MRWNTFARSAAFAAAAALGWFPWAVVTGPIVGGWSAWRLYVVGVTTLYVAGLETGLMAAALTAAVGVGLAAVARTPGELAIGMAAMLGVARSGLARRAGPARAVAIEVGLLACGLVFAGFLAGRSPVAVALALWGFFLVQSFYFLVGGTAARSAGRWRADPFEEAYARATAVLDGRGV